MTLQVDLLRPLTHSVCIEVTSKCNLRCSYCHKSDEVREALPASNADMTDNMIDDLYRYCKAAGVKHVTLSQGGETTMYAGWHNRIAKFIDDAEMECHIVSNFARLFKDDDLEALAKFRDIQISFDSSDWEMVRKLRSRADLRTITFNILKLRQKAQEIGRSPTLVVNCVLWRDNIGHVAKLAGFCRELAIDQLLLTEGMISTENNFKVPDTLDTLNNDDVLTLARQINTAEDETSGSGTALRLQEHLQVRIGEVCEQLREGAIPANPAAHFHRRLTTSACPQPWTSPFVGADGNVWPCCQGGRARPAGNLASAGMAAILDSEAFRAIRASILERRPIVPCHDCSFAQAKDWPEFIRDIRERQGDTQLEPYDSDTRRAVWPGLMARSEYPILLENSALTVDGQGAGTLVEDRGNGLHRVLIDVDRSKFSEIVFFARPAGRRRLRIDFGRPGEIVGRARIAMTRHAKADVDIGSFKCSVTAAHDSWYRIDAAFSNPEVLSEVVVFLMREDNAVTYAGDGQSGLEISNFTIA